MKSSRAADGANASSALLALSFHDIATPATTPPGVPEEEDQDSGDLPTGTDEDALEADDLDTDQVVDTE